MLHRVESNVNSDIDRGDGGGTVLRDGDARALAACTSVEHTLADLKRKCSLMEAKLEVQMALHLEYADGVTKSADVQPVDLSFIHGEGSADSSDLSCTGSYAATLQST